MRREMRERSYPIDYFTSFSSTYEAEKLHAKKHERKKSTMFGCRCEMKSRFILKC